MLPLLATVKLARKALRRWQSLPDDQRQRLAGDAAQIRGLLAEAAAQRRDREQLKLIVGQLADATESLSRAMTPEVLAVAAEESRRVRYGQRVISSGVRRWTGGDSGDDFPPVLPSDGSSAIDSVS
jgi:hypothetical protein